MNMARAVINVKRKRVEERGSLEKFVGGESSEIVLSWATEKSSMQFCKSRILRKKSLDSSLAGLTVGAGANAGPVVGYWVEVSTEIVDGGAGCRAIKEGMRSPRRRNRSGKTVSMYGSRQMKVYIARKDKVWVGFIHERRRTTFAWKRNTTPIRALNRLKLFDIVVILNEGRLMSSDCGNALLSRFEDWSSIGITC